MYVVLDEADKLLSMGFQAQVERLHKLLLPPTPPAELGGAGGGKADKKQAAAGAGKKQAAAGAGKKQAAAGAGKQRRAKGRAAGQAAEEGGEEVPGDGSGSSSSGSSARPQVALFTATMPPEVERVAEGWLRAPLHVRVAHSAASISRTVTQVGGGALAALHIGCACAQLGRASPGVRAP